MRAAYRELRAAREPRAAACELSPAAASLRPPLALTDAREAAPPLPISWPRRALARLQAAESALARHLDAAGLPAAAARRPFAMARLAPLVDRLRRGDLTPDTLARTRREIQRSLRLAGAPAALPPPPRTAAGLADALANHAASRSAVLRAARHLAPAAAAAATVPAAAPPSPHRPPAAPDLHRLAEAVARLQQTAAHLDHLAFGIEPRTPAPQPSLAATPDPPAPQALAAPPADTATTAPTTAPATAPSPNLATAPGAPPPLRYFLARPDLAARPHRAVAAWAAHAAEQGLPAERIAQAIQRFRLSHFASPRLFGADYARFLAGAVARLARTLAPHPADDP